MSIRKRNSECPSTYTVDQIWTGDWHSIHYWRRWKSNTCLTGQAFYSTAPVMVSTVKNSKFSKHKNLGRPIRKSLVLRRSHRYCGTSATKSKLTVYSSPKRQYLNGVFMGPGSMVLSVFHFRCPLYLVNTAGDIGIARRSYGGLNFDILNQQLRQRAFLLDGVKQSWFFSGSPLVMGVTDGSEKLLLW